MPFFKYKAVSKEGKEVSAIEEAVSVSQLNNKLTLKGLIPIEIEEITEKSSGKYRFFWAKKGISKDDMVLLLYEIGVLIDKNVHITQIFDIISGQTSNQEIKKAVLSAKSYLNEGYTVADSFQRTGIFPEFLVEMIRAGETSGSLGKIFLSASKFIESQEEFKRKVANSLIYPSIVVAVGFVAMIVVVIYVVPAITKIYEQFGKELPLSTKFVVLISHIFSTVFKFFPLFIIILIIGRRKFIDKKIIDNIKLKIPFFKKLHLYSIYSNWSNTLSLLLSGGLTLDRAVDISNKTIPNSILKNEFDSIVPEIKEGKPLSKLLELKNLLPEDGVKLIKIGEETGQIDNMLELVSQIYRKQAEKLMNIFIAYLEPVILIVLSIFIGFLIFATLLPIFSINVQ